MIITILRKPLEGSVADNVLKHGCGALNIDASRVSSHDKTKNHSRKPEASKPKGIYGDSKEQETHQTKGQEIGRFPANFILTHREGCELKGTKKIKSSSGRGAVKKESSAEKLGNQGYSYSKESRKEGTVMICHVDEDGKETVADWACVEGCPVKEIDRQSGSIKSGGRSAKNYADSDSDRLVYGGFSGVAKEIQPSSGGASRFFKQFKKEESNEP